MISKKSNIYVLKQMCPGLLLIFVVFFMCVLVSALLMRSPELSELLPCQWQLDLDPEVGMK